MKRYDYTYFVREGIRGIFLHGFMSFAAVGVIVACLLIMGSFTLLAVNIDRMISGFEDQNEILAFVDESLSLKEAQSIEVKLSEVPNVAGCEFITNEKALEDYRSKLTSMESDLLKGLEENPLRHRYRITLDDISIMGKTVGDISAVPGIEKVNARTDIAAGFVNARHVVNIVSITLIIVLLAISVFIISNTVKLATFDRREEIAIMKMVGATNAFIRWPFIIEGMLLGLLGAVFAYFVQWGIYSYLTVNDTVSHAIGLIPFGELAIYIVVVFVVAGFFVGVGGSVLTIRKFLKV